MAYLDLVVDKGMDNLWRKAKRLASVLLEQNCHLRQFDVTLGETHAQEAELIAKAMRDQGCHVEVQTGNRLHVTCP